MQYVSSLDRLPTRNSPFQQFLRTLREGSRGRVSIQRVAVRTARDVGKGRQTWEGTQLRLGNNGWLMVGWDRWKKRKPRRGMLKMVSGVFTPPSRGWNPVGHVP